MKKTILNVVAKLCLGLSVFGISEASIAQVICQNQNQVNFTISNLNGSIQTNAVSLVSSGTSNGVDTYKTYTVTIPFYENSLLGTLQLRTNTFCDYPFPQSDTYGTINVNGVSYASHTYTIPSGLSLGHHNYTVKSYCGSQFCNTQLIDINVVKEASPSLSLTLNGYCKKNSNNLYNGYIGFKIFGSYVNASKLYLEVLSGCTSYPDTKLTLLSLDSSLPTNTLPSYGAEFYDCNAATTYTVTMQYRSTSIHGQSLTYTIPNTAYGWTNYSFTKNFMTCMNELEQDPIKFKTSNLIFPNPVKETVTIKVSENEKLMAVTIFDNSNAVQKKETFKNSNSEQKIDVSNLKKGIYFVEIVTDKDITREKIIKE
nr:T9SS type A sorting domain-containing protein [uncultured Flavobacterium sp.]